MMRMWLICLYYTEHYLELVILIGPFATSHSSVWVDDSFCVRQLLLAYVFSRHYWNTMRGNTF